MGILTFGGGVNQRDDINIDIDECVEGENFRLQEQSRSLQPRLPFDLKGTAPNGLETRGIMQLKTTTGTKTTLSQNGGVVYSVSSSFVYTDESTNPPNPLTVTVDAGSKLRSLFWGLDDYLVITDIAKLTPVLNWDGTTLAVHTHAIVGVTNLYAKYAVEFGGRVWLFNVTTDSSDLPHVMIASAFEDPQVFDSAKRAGDATFSTGDEAFFLATPDLKPINGVVKFFETVYISTEDGLLFKLTGSDSTNYAIVGAYAGSSSLGDEAMVNIGNDMMYMRRSGQIELLSTTERFGDVSADDASRWIRDETQNLTSAIGVYDQSVDLVHFFVGGKILTFSKLVYATEQLSPWVIDTTQHPCNFDTSAVAYIEAPDDNTVNAVYFGDMKGNLFAMNGSGGNGDGGTSLIRTTRKTKLITEIDGINDLVHGRLVYRRKGLATVQMDLEWTESYATTSISIPLKAAIVSAGTYFYGSQSNPQYYSGHVTTWTISTAYVVDDVVAVSGGGFFKCTVGGTSGGDDSDLAGGSDTGVSWESIEIPVYGAGGIAEEVVSTVGFQPQGKGTSFFLTLSLNTNVPFLINRLETPEREVTGRAAGGVRLRR